MPKKFEYKYDWDEMKWYFFHEYDPVSNRITLKDVAIKFDVPYQSIRRYAAEDNWIGDRAWMRAFGGPPQTKEEREREVNEIVSHSLRYGRFK